MKSKTTISLLCLFIVGAAVALIIALQYYGTETAKANEEQVRREEQLRAKNRAAEARAAEQWEKEKVKMKDLAILKGPGDGAFSKDESSDIEWRVKRIKEELQDKLYKIDLKEKALRRIAELEGNAASNLDAERQKATGEAMLKLTAEMKKLGKLVDEAKQRATAIKQ